METNIYPTLGCNWFLSLLCNKKCWHVACRRLTLFNNKLLTLGNKERWWYSTWRMNIEIEFHRIFVKNVYRSDERCHVTSSVTILMKKELQIVTDSLLPVGKIQYLFSFGLALQHQLFVCRNLILLIIYFLVVRMYDMWWYWNINRRIGTCAGSTIKIVFNKCLSESFAFPSISDCDNFKYTLNEKILSENEMLITRCLFFHAH